MRAECSIDNVELERRLVSYCAGKRSVERYGLVLRCNGVVEMILCSQKSDEAIKSYIESLPPAMRKLRCHTNTDILIATYA